MAAPCENSGENASNSPALRNRNNIYTVCIRLLRERLRSENMPLLYCLSVLLSGTQRANRLFLHVQTDVRAGAWRTCLRIKRSILHFAPCNTAHTVTVGSDLLLHYHHLVQELSGPQSLSPVCWPSFTAND